MQDLIVHDTRLEGRRPGGKEVLQVDETFNLGALVAWLMSKSAQYASDVRVKIFSHGMEVGEVPGADGKWVKIASQGGWGLQLCRENLHVENVHYLSILRGRIKQIDILGCGAAYITPGREGKAGDGNFFCYRLAQITGSYVRASTTVQEYVDTNFGIYFGDWEGTVVTYSPTGGPGVAPIRD